MESFRELISAIKTNHDDYKHLFNNLPDEI